VHEELGADTAGTADHIGSKGYPRPYDVVLSNKSWGKKKEGEAGRVWSDGVHLPKSPLHLTEPCFPGDGCLQVKNAE